MADNPYATPYMNPNAARIGLYDMRMMSTANRMETPFEHGMGRGYRRPMAEGTMLGNLGAMANEPDYSGFTYNPQARAVATQALAPYGQAPLAPEAVKSNVLLPNSGFFGAHPRLSAAIEGAVFAGAAAHGGMTPGESIQGAFEGMIGSKRIREGMQRQQFARPFEAAGMMEGLMDAQQKRELQSADIEHLRAVNEHLKNGDYEKAQQLSETNRHQEAMEAMTLQQRQIEQQRIEATAPRNVGEGRYGVFHPENLPPEGGQVDPKKPLWSIEQDPEWEKMRAEDRDMQRRAAGQAGMVKGYITEPDPKNPGQTRQRYIELAPGQIRPKSFDPIQEGYQQKREDKAVDTGANKRQAFLAQKRKPSELVRMGYQGDLTDGKAQQKFLGDFYDNYIAPNVPEAGGNVPTYDPKTGTIH